MRFELCVVGNRFHRPLGRVVAMLCAVNLMLLLPELAAGTPAAMPPSGTPAAVTRPSPSPMPTATPAKVAEKPADTWAPELKKNCARHFPGLIQSELRAACATVGSSYPTYGKMGAATKCRLNYGEEPREVMACLIGVEIRSQMESKKDDFKKRLQLCSEQYPAHTEIDAFLQESCLVGIYLPTFTEKPHFENCSQISPERSFIGPCAVGLSLAQDLNSPVVPNRQNQLCEQYFDHKQFHSGYRACLNGRSAGQDPKGSVDDVLKNCSEVTADSNNDTERAACFVGANIYRHLLKQDDINKGFQKCGQNKVSYEDRDVLACLTASSLLDYSSRVGAESGCKEIFKTGKSSSRGNCISSLNLF